VKIIIVGAGEVGRHLAVCLSKEAHSIAIIEENETLAEEIDKQVDALVLAGDGASVNTLVESTVVINADATSLSELREEQVERADFFVATSISDEDNVMTCLQAHNLGAKHCLTLVHRADYADAMFAMVTSKARHKFLRLIAK
jgi:trk system potassium uptake protein TrkA